MQSMTGFAEKSFHSKALSAKFSIRSLNHRFLDWNYRGAQIGEVENKLKAVTQKKLHRGRIEVSLELDHLAPSSWELVVNETLLRKILASLDKLSSRMKKKVNFSLDNILNLPHLVELRKKELSEKQKAFLVRSFEKTLDEVLMMREREGREIAKELRSRLVRIGQIVRRIEKRHKMQPALIKEKLRKRMKELSREAPLPEERLAEETSLFAQRFDLAEEMMRLRSHLDYAVKLISAARQEPVGKKLDFVCQELYREANTINSKSQDFEISKESLSIKGEVESIRQQLQNIE
jgi:uncharacterized protein (TIGR00255 family)